MAPHRHNVTKECYIRRADRTEKMTMREIQDLTLQVERGMAAIEKSFRRRQELFAQTWANLSPVVPAAFGMRATLVPLTPIYVDRVYRNKALYPPTLSVWIQSQFQIGGLPGAAEWRPILRGAQGVYRSRQHDSPRTEFRRTVFCDGVMEYLLLESYAADMLPPRQFNQEDPLAVAANSLLAAEQFRRVATTPNIEYGLEIEMKAQGIERAPNEPEPFPRYTVGPREEFGNLWALFARDVRNAVGLDSHSGEATVDFDRAFRDLGLPSGP